MADNDNDAPKIPVQTTVEQALNVPAAICGDARGGDGSVQGGVGTQIEAHGRMFGMQYFGIIGPNWSERKESNLRRHLGKVVLCR